jgi:hypothetical protein
MLYGMTDDEDGPHEPRASPLGDSDRLLSLSGPSESETNLGHLAPELRYTEGFRRAADVLANYARSNNLYLEDLAMPILYCYRQSLELRLKYLLTLGEMLEGRPAEVETTHDLMHLWSKVTPVLEQSWPSGAPPVLARIDTVLREFAHIDGGGYAFRYAIDKKGKPSLPQDLPINLENVQIVASRVEQHLDDAAEHIDWVLMERLFERRSALP